MANDSKVDKAFKELSDKFPKRYKLKATTYLKALLYAIAEGDGYIDSQVDAVSDNSLVVTASGKYLDRLGSLYGVGRGRATGIQDDDFQKLIPVVGSNPKQIMTTLQKVIDYIYGPYASHANTTCSSPSPYSLSNGSRLRIRVDDSEIDIYFKSTDALDISATTAQEIAVAISERTNGKVIGSVVNNVRTGEQFVNIRTKTMGSQGFIQVLGGDSQAAMRFPEIRPTRDGIATYNVEIYLGTDEITYKFISGVSPAMRTAGVRIGDYVTISSGSGFNSKNCGTFKVSFLDEDSFRVTNSSGVPEIGVTNINVDDFVFYRPDLGNILLAVRPATILHTAQRELTVMLPVTSPIVKRTLRGSHHFHCGVSNVISATADSMELASPSNFNAPGSVHKVGNREMAEGVVSSVTGSNLTMINGEGWPISGAAYSPTERRFYYYQNKIGNLLTGITPTPPLTLAGTVLKYAKKYSYTGVSGSTLTGVTPNPINLIGYDVVSETEIIDGFPGSFLYDRPVTKSSLKWPAPFEYDFTSSYVISNQETHITEKIQQGSSRTVVGVDDIESWGDEGYFMIAFGTKEQEGPIKYLNKVGQEALIIDPSHIFDRDHLSGISIRRLRGLGLATPRTNGQDLPVYTTGTSQARSLLAEYLRSLVAAGVVLKFKVIIPEQKWDVLPLLYSTDPLVDDLSVIQPEDSRSSTNALPPSSPPSPQVTLVFDPIVVAAAPAIEIDPEDPPLDPIEPAPVGWGAPVLAGVANKSSINLSWSSVSGATAYRIFRNTANSVPVVIEIPSNTTSYTDNTITNEITYTYTMHAIRGSNLTGYEASSLSNEITMLPKYSIGNDLTTMTTLNTYWQKPSVSAGFATPSNYVAGRSYYKFFRGEYVGGNYLAASAINLSLQPSYGYVDTTMIVSKTYYYYVIHSIDGVDSMPSNNSVVTITPEQIVLSGGIGTDYDKGIQAAGLSFNKIYQAANTEIHMGTSIQNMSLVGTSISTYIQIPDLESGTAYYIKAVAKHSTGITLNESNVIQATSAVTPATPTNGVIQYPFGAGNNSMVYITWNGSASYYVIKDSRTSTPPAYLPTIAGTGTPDTEYNNAWNTNNPASTTNGTFYLHVWSLSNGLRSITPLTIGPITLAPEP